MSKLKVYLAAPYVMKDLMKARAETLRNLGIEVTSTWLDEPFKPTQGPEDLTPEQNRDLAENDISDIHDSHIMVFQPDDTKTIVRAGRHVEFGIALALEMSIFVVGETRENIFHYGPNVTHFPTFTHVVRTLVDLAKELAYDKISVC